MKKALTLPRNEFPAWVKVGAMSVPSSFSTRFISCRAFSGKARAFFMKRVGFPLRSKWTSEEYLRFLRQNGWAVRKSAVLKASFPLTYAECVKSEV